MHWSARISRLGFFIETFSLPEERNFLSAFDYVGNMFTLTTGHHHPTSRSVFLQGYTRSWQTDCNLFQMTWAWRKLSAFSLVASCLLLLGAQTIWEIKLLPESELRKRSVISRVGAKVGERFRHAAIIFTSSTYNSPRDSLRRAKLQLDRGYSTIHYPLDSSTAIIDTTQRIHPSSMNFSHAKSYFQRKLQNIYESVAAARRNPGVLLSFQQVTMNCHRYARNFFGSSPGTANKTALEPATCLKK